MTWPEIPKNYEEEGRGNWLLDIDSLQLRDEYNALLSLLQEAYNEDSGLAVWDEDQAYAWQIPAIQFIKAEAQRRYDEADK